MKKYNRPGRKKQPTVEDRPIQNFIAAWLELLRAGMDPTDLISAAKEMSGAGMDPEELHKELLEIEQHRDSRFETTPILYGRVHTWADEITSIKVWCPGCSDYHSHGWPHDEGKLSHRVAHCFTSMYRDYLIAPIYTCSPVLKGSKK